MHSAPAVNFPVGRSRCWGWFMGLTGVLGFMVGLMLHFKSSINTADQVLYDLFFLASFVFAVNVWRRSMTGHLQWDGQVWRWTVEGQFIQGFVTLHFDAQLLMIMTLRTDAGHVVWIWPERALDPTHWSALRRAVHSHTGLHPTIADDVPVTSSRP